MPPDPLTTRRHGQGPCHSLTAALVIGALVVMTVLAGVTSPARAGGEPTVVSTTPLLGAVLWESPAQIALDFDQAVDGVTVDLVSSTGDTILAGAPAEKVADRSVVAAVPPLGDGSYVVGWSAGEASEGGFVFSVDRSGEGAVAATNVVVDDDGDGVSRVAIVSVRALAYLAVLLLVGLAAVIALRWPDGAGKGGVRHWLWAGWGVATATAVGGFLLENVRNTGLPLIEVFDVGRWSDTAGTWAGGGWAGRLLVLVLALPVLVAVSQQPTVVTRPRWRASAAAVALALLTAMSVTTLGDADHLPGLGLVVGVLHSAAAALVIGVLAAALSGADAAREPATSSTSIWRLASWAMGLLVVTGLVDAWRQVGDGASLVGTRYGALVLVKVGLAAILAVTTWRGAEWTRARSLGLAAAVAAVATTAGLVGTVPGRADLADDASARDVTGNGAMELTMAPAAVGDNEVHLYLFDELGAPAAVEKVQVWLDDPEGRLPPFRIDVFRAGPNHFLSYGAPVPFDASWSVLVEAETDVEDLDLTATLDVR